MPLASETRAVQPRSSLARSLEAVTWRTSPGRNSPVTRGAAPPHPCQGGGRLPDRRDYLALASLLLQRLDAADLR
jgi:hypothetical protein